MCEVFAIHSVHSLQSVLPGRPGAPDVPQQALNVAPPLLEALLKGGPLVVHREAAPRTAGHANNLLELVEASLDEAHVDGADDPALDVGNLDLQRLGHGTVGQVPRGRVGCGGDQKWKSQDQVGFIYHRLNVVYISSTAGNHRIFGN